MSGTLLEDLCTFIIIFHLIFFRMRTVSDKISGNLRENQNTTFVFNNVFTKTVLIRRQRGKTLYCRAEPR